MFAWWSGWVTVTTRAAPLAREGLLGLDALNVGLKARAPQSVTANGLDGCATAPWIAPTVESVVSGPQLVGLKRNLDLLTATERLRRCSGTPPTMRGRVAVAITRAECW